MNDLLELMRTRKSVRWYDGKGLKQEDLEKIRAYADTLKNPFGVPIKFVFLNAEEKGLSSPVVTGESWYVAGLEEAVPGTDAAYGFSFEKLILYAWSLGVGTVWIGGTMDRKLFENAAGKTELERMPCVTPLGYPSGKRSMKDKLSRKAIGAESRKPAEEIFFENDFGTPVSAETKDRESELIEMVLWAPSAVNRQPWRVLMKDGAWHFYVKHDRGFIHETTGDLQKIDTGIALCHLFTGLEKAGKTPRAVVGDPGVETPNGVEYVATVLPE